MKRKVNRVGQNTLTVSLPAKWVKEYNVKQGDEIEVDQRSNSLIISRRRAPEEREIEINVVFAERFLRRFIVMPYIKGYDTIRVRYGETKVYGLVQKAMNRYLLGFEIIEHGKNFCILKDIAKGLDYDFNINQRRYFLQVKSVVQELYSAIKNKDESELDHLLIIDESVDKLSLFMRRILNMRGHEDESKGKSIYYINNLMETISDYCRDISLMIKETKIWPSEKFLEILKLNLDIIEFYQKMFYKYDQDKLIDFKKMNMEVVKKIKDLYSKEKNTDIIYYHYLLSMVQLEHNMSEELI